MRTWWTILVVGLLAVVGAGPVDAADPTTDGRLEQAAALRVRGDVRGAIAMLKDAVRSNPDDQRLRQALAMAYVEDNNVFWALKVLGEYADTHPPACEARALMAWIHLSQANLALADELSSVEGCESPPETHARLLLVRSRIAEQRGDRVQAADLADQARRSPRLYEEDLALLDALRTRDDPGHLPLVSWRVDLAAGWTSNGLAGSPVDPVDADEAASTALLSADARLRLVVPAARTIRPVLDVQLRAIEQTDEAVRLLSYRQPALRPGLMFGGGLPRLALLYGFDAVQIEGSDRYDQGPLWYSEAHRVDYELEATEYLFAFGGGGKRTYREAGRTRWEAEQGLAVSSSLGRGHRLSLGASARWNRARNQAYDQYGGTGLAQLLLALPLRFEGRLNVAVSFDDYPASAGYFAGAEERARTDWLVRVKPGLWTPSRSGVRLGVDYDWTRRNSSAQAYSYTDHRVLLHVTWALDSDRTGVEVVPASGRERMRYGVGEAGKVGEEELRIRDLMRQDESVKRGSSCQN